MRVLSVHQGHELYGSDRSFLLCLNALRTSFDDPEMTVLLPKTGELEDVLREQGFDVAIANLWVPRKSDGLWGLIKKVFLFPFSVMSALRRANAAGLLYINTSVVFDYLVAARFSKTPAIVHVREIPTGFSARVIRTLLKFSKATLVFNSGSTRASFGLPESVKQHTVPNSVPDRYPDPVERAPSGSSETFKLLMVGRINSWKGQDLLLAALRILSPESQARLSVKILGDVYGESGLMDELKTFAAKNLATTSVSFEGFQSETRPYYLWANAVVVPSRKPEPFGLVAIEAMSAERNLIVADHGGLAEIVKDGLSGIKVPPNDAKALAAAIQSLMDNEIGLGTGARARFEAEYMPARLEARMKAIFKDVAAG